MSGLRRAPRHNPAGAERPSAMRIWLMAARPRTLPAAVAPVLVGTALAATEGTFKVPTFIAAMLGATFIQIGTNLSNDYSDARRGADTEDRLGPVRVTAGGLVPPRQVLIATAVAFGLAVLAGSLPDRDRRLAGGGDRRGVDRRRDRLHRRAVALGYDGLGDVFVMPFFGEVAVAAPCTPRSTACRGRRCGSRSRWGCSPRRSWWSTTCATSRPTAGRASARWRSACGRHRTRNLYTAMIAGAFVAAPLPWLLGSSELGPWLLAPLPAVWLAVPLVRDGAHPQRRARAERGAGRDRDAAARVLPAALVRHPGQLMRLETEPVALALREPLRAAWGTLRERPLLRVRLVAATGSPATGRRRRSSPTTAYRSRRCAPRWTSTRACWPTSASARRRSCSQRAAPSATCRRRSRRSTSRCGTSPASARSAPSRRCCPSRPHARSTSGR